MFVQLFPHLLGGPGPSCCVVCRRSAGGSAVAEGIFAAQVHLQNFGTILYYFRAMLNPGILSKSWTLDLHDLNSGCPDYSNLKIRSPWPALGSTRCARQCDSRCTGASRPPARSPSRPGSSPCPHSRSRTRRRRMRRKAAKCVRRATTEGMGNRWGNYGKFWRKPTCSSSQYRLVLCLLTRLCSCSCMAAARFTTGDLAKAFLEMDKNGFAK